MKKIYVAGSLFSDKEIHARVEEEKLLKENLKDIKVYNPITNDEINDKTKQPTARDIFMQDTKKVIESDIITADLDDNDMGMAMELGIAYGINYMRDQIIQCLGVENVESALRKVLKDIPNKTIYATCSDIRQDTKNENGRYKSWGINQYIVGGVEEMGKIHRHFLDVIVDLKEGESNK